MKNAVGIVLFPMFGTRTDKYVIFLRNPSVFVEKKSYLCYYIQKKTLL